MHEEMGLQMGKDKKTNEGLYGIYGTYRKMSGPNQSEDVVP